MEAGRAPERRGQVKKSERRTREDGRARSAGGAGSKNNSEPAGRHRETGHPGRRYDRTSRRSLKKASHICCRAGGEASENGTSRPAVWQNFPAFTQEGLTCPLPGGRKKRGERLRSQGKRKRPYRQEPVGRRLLSFTKNMTRIRKTAADGLQKRTENVKIKV